MGFLSEAAIKQLGFKAVGKNVLISEKTSFYGTERISIGDNCRIDDFCVISAGAGGISIGRHVHIAVYVSIIGAGRIILEDFVGLSGRTSIYSSSDDFSGIYLTGPTVPKEYTNITSKAVHLKKHTVIGAGCTILPGVTISENCAVGAMSLVIRDIPKNEIHAGHPAKKMRDRELNTYALEEDFIRRSQ